MQLGLRRTETWCGTVSGVEQRKKAGRRGPVTREMGGMRVGADVGRARRWMREGSRAGAEKVCGFGTAARTTASNVPLEVPEGSMRV